MSSTAPPVGSLTSAQSTHQRPRAPRPRVLELSAAASASTTIVVVVLQGAWPSKNVDRVGASWALERHQNQCQEARTGCAAIESFWTRRLRTLIIKTTGFDLPAARIWSLPLWPQHPNLLNRLVKTRLTPKRASWFVACQNEPLFHLSHSNRKHGLSCHFVCLFL